MLRPVGALTSKPFAFVARSWEFVTVPSIDVYDSFISSVRLDFRGNDILRVLPLINEELNQEWITDKIRFSYDGLKKQRVLKPFLNRKISLNPLDKEFNFFCLINFNFYSNSLVKISFEEAYQKASSLFDSQFLFCFLGKENDIETLTTLDNFSKLFFKKAFYYSPDFAKQGNSCILQDVVNYLVDQEKVLTSSYVVLGDVMLRWESPILNIKLLKRSQEDLVTVYSLGNRIAFNYSVLNIGSNLFRFLADLFKGRSLFVRRLLKISSETFFLLSHRYTIFLHSFDLVVNRFLKSFNLGIFMPWASSVAISELLVQGGFSSISSVNSGSLLSLESDSIVDCSHFGNKIAFSTHGYSNLSYFNLIFPSPAYSEHNAHYRNLFGMERYSRFGFVSNYDVLPIWGSLHKIVDDLAEFKQKLIYSLSNLLLIDGPHLNSFNDEDSYPYLFNDKHFNFSSFFSINIYSPLYETVTNFYLTHHSNRFSKPMSLASIRFGTTFSNFI